MRKYIFIGNENDPLTKKWGIKEGEAYKIDILPFSKKPTTIIHVGSERYACPYSSIEAFRKNWQEID